MVKQRFIRLGVIYVTLGVCQAVQASTSRAELVALVRSAIQMHTPDPSFAKSLGKLALSQKLDSTTIEEMESEGAGPETVAALERLGEISAGLPVATDAPVYAFPPHPTIEQQKDFFSLIDVNAMNYSASLPDFICTEVIRRFTAPLRPPRSTSWKPKDTLTIKLTYFGNSEKYELTLVNGRTTSRRYENFGGVIFRGDFGTQLLVTFKPETKTKFEWDHWTRLRKRLTQVYSYRSPQEHSHFTLTSGREPYGKTIVAGRYGFIYADNETHMVMRITGYSDSVPPGFPISGTTSILDYDLADVGGRQFLVPLRSEQQMKEAPFQYKNVAGFGDYRKFVGESTISFGDPDPAPAPTPK